MIAAGYVGPTTKLNSTNIYECPVWSQIAKFNTRPYYHLYGIICMFVCVSEIVVNIRLCLVCFMQFSSTEWFLGVQIQNFVNLYNAEIINGMYCCCDDNETCGSAPYELIGMCKDPTTTQICETYFLVNIRNCLSLNKCSRSKTYQLNYTSSASMFDHGILFIPFMEMELGDEVRTKISYLLI